MDRDCDASRVLAAALEQMDGIISSASLGGSADEANRNGERQNGIGRLLADLKHALEWNVSADDNASFALDPAAAKFVHAWLDRIVQPAKTSTPVSGDYGDLQDKVSHLESEKENLALQVSVLTDQLELQKDKLLELEAALAEKKQLLERTEHLLKQEVLLKKKIEADRLDILADIPALKLKVATTEREKSELESKVKKLETDVVLLRSYLAEREAELITKCGKISHHGSVSSVGDGSGLRSTPTKFGPGLDWKEKSPVSCDGSGDKQMCSEREARLAEKPPMCPRSASATLPSNHSALRASTPLQSLHRANSDDGMHMVPWHTSSLGSV